MFQSTCMVMRMATALGVSLTLWSVAQAQMTITTYAGTGVLAYSGDGGPAGAAALNYPKGMAVDAFGNLYIADTANYRVRRVSGGMITTVAGNGVNAFSGDGGLATNASFSDVTSVVVDTAGNLYISDPDNRRIRKVTPAGIVSTIAGVGVEGFSGDGGPAVSAMIGRPEALALDAFGNLYFADSTQQRVRRISTNGTITTVAGNGIGGFAGDGGPAVNASLDFPIGIAIDPFGNIYVADGNNNRIRKITVGGMISTVVGTGAALAASASGDGGPAVSASLNIPSDVAVDFAGNIYIADSGHNEVRMVNTAGMIVTLAGTGANGYSGDGGPATQALLNYPWGVTTDASGNVYIADRVNSRVRKLASGVILPPPSLSAGQILNSASGASTIAPGSIVSVYGANFATASAAAPGAPYPTVLGQTSVTFNGVPVPLLYVSGGQINAQAPFNLPTGTVSVQVNRGGMTSAVQYANVTAFSPGIFIIDQATRAGAFLHVSTFGVVSSASPAKAGEVVALYATGLGALTIPVATGVPAPGGPPLPQTVTLPVVTIGGFNAPVSFSGLAPGFAGLYQMNLQIPTGVTSGLQPVQIMIGGFTSNVATIAIQ